MEVATARCPLLPASQGYSSLKGLLLGTWKAQRRCQGRRGPGSCGSARDEPSHHEEWEERLMGAPRGPYGTCLWVQREKSQALCPSTRAVSPCWQQQISRNCSECPKQHLQPQLFRNSWPGSLRTQFDSHSDQERKGWLMTSGPGSPQQ